MRSCLLGVLLVVVTTAELDAQTRHTRRRDTRPNGQRQAYTKSTRARGVAGGAVVGSPSAAQLRNGKRLAQKRVLPRASTLNQRRSAKPVPRPDIRSGRAFTGADIEFQRRIAAVERLKVLAAGANNEQLLQRMERLEQLTRGYRSTQTDQARRQANTLRR